MVDAVLAGDGLDAVAALSAEAAGGTGAIVADALVARARRLGVDLAGGAVAVRVAAQAAYGARAAAVVRDASPAGLIVRRGDEVDALLAGERAGAEDRAWAIAERLSPH